LNERCEGDRQKRWEERMEEERTKKETKESYVGVKKRRKTRIKKTRRKEGKKIR
jgi:hypothetical protein